MDLYRKKLLHLVELGNEHGIEKLHAHIRGTDDLRAALDSLILAVNNSSATLERFERKAAKDILRY